MKKKPEKTNPIDKDHITEEPGTLSYGHHRGSFPIIPTKQGTIKNKSIAHFLPIIGFHQSIQLKHNL